MFGQPFGGGFGAPTPTPPFGSSNNNNNFGGGNNTFGTFGSSSNAFGAGGGAGGGGGFGAPAPAPSTGFGGFGSSAPAPTFGSSNAFGSTTNTFGGATAFGGGGSTNTFGSSGGFGAPASTPFGSSAPSSGGLFGSNPAPAPFGQAPAVGGLFGSAPAPSTGGGLFGASTSTFGGTSTFGSTTTGFGAAPAPALFGSPAPAFGSPAPVFGAPAPSPGGMFGAPGPSAGGGLFGGGVSVPGATGTKTTPFQTTARPDGTSTIQMQTISAMPAFENKSLEELRYEDYMQGNKGTAVGGAQGGFGFGSAAPAPGGLFGSNPAPAPFGQAGSTPFGAAAPSTGFGSGSFGKPVTGSLFGGGATTAPSPAFGFGLNPTPAFGAPAASAPSTGLFGSSTAPAPAFGVAPAPSFGGFGTTPSPAFGTPAPSTGLFGSTAPAPAFGAAPATSFGGFGTSPSPAQAFGAFGAPAPATGLFGQPAALAFGPPAPTPGGGLFGGVGFSAPAPTPSLFGASPTPAVGFGGFGSPSPAPAFGFGSPAPLQPASLFGQPTTAPLPALPPAGSIIPLAASEVLSHQIQALENQRKDMEKLEVWRGRSGEDSSVIPASQPQLDGDMSFGLIGNSHCPPYGPSPKSNAKIRPRGFAPAISPSSTTSTSALDNIGAVGRLLMSPDTYAASSVKRLVLKPGTPTPKLRLRLGNGSNTSEAKTPLAIQRTESPGADAPQREYGSLPSPMQSPYPTGTPLTIPVFSRDTPPSSRLNQTTPSAVKANTNVFSGGKTVASLEKLAPPVDPAFEYYQKVVGSPDGIPPETPSPHAASEPQSSRKKRPSYLPRMTKPGYAMSPSLEDLSLMSEAGLATISGFSISHDPYGMIEWEGAVDVRYADLDASIVIGQSDVSVYTRDEEAGRKPPVGSKLNRPAVITFFNVFPKNGGPSADEETKRKFAIKIEKSSRKMHADLLSYNKDSGEWKIRVQHFSRYGLDDDDSEAEDTPADSAPRGTVEKQIEDVEFWEDAALGMDNADGLNDAAVVSDVEMDKESSDGLVLRDAEAAYVEISGAVRSSRDLKEEMEDQEDEDEFDDGWVSGDKTAVDRVRTSEEDYNWAATRHSDSGICSRIARKVFGSQRRAPACFDYGLRMAQSFRVAWSADGSFMKVCVGGMKLQKFRPVFHDPAAFDGDGTKYLETHKSASHKLATFVDDGSPRFVLPMAIGNAGDSSSHEDLRRAISTFAGNGQEIRDQTFSLLACFVDNEDSMEVNEPMSSGLNRLAKSSQFEARRKEAVVAFLKKACYASAKADSHAAMARDDVHGAILAALTGGDVARACELSFEAGDGYMAACIATYDADGSNDMRQQVQQGVDSKIYRLLSGDVDAAGQLDWMRAILVRLFYANPRRVDCGLPHVLEAFSLDIAASAVPYPSPAHARGSKSTALSILYCLLRLAERPQSMALTDVVEPSGASKYSHDCSLAFHLACCCSAAGVSEPMSPLEEELLINGYCAQLCLSGRWEWAVYVCLCTFNPDMMEASATEWKRNKAKEIVLRNFQNDRQSESKRDFLERDVGVPKEWLYEALVLRQGRMGDPFEYIGNLAAFSPSQASAAVDEILLPNLLFMSQKDLQRSLSLLTSFGSELSALSAAVLNLFQLSKDVSTLMSTPQDKALEYIPRLADDLREIEATFLAHRSENEKMKDGIDLKFCSSFDIIPMSCMLHEILGNCVLLKLQLKAIEKGIKINGKMSRENLTTQLAFHTLDAYDDVLQRNASVMRALR